MPLPDHITGPAGPLQIIAEGFETAADTGVAVVCHPHPLHGGTMTNKVVTTTAKALRDLGMGTLRFNFRGVGESAGQYDHGNGETEDLLAVIDWVRQDIAGPVWLAGFSFGAYVALRAVSRRPIDRLITIAPPVNLYDFNTIAPVPCPWLLIQGDADQVVPCEDVKHWVKSLSHPPTTIYFKGVEHFFHRRLVELRKTLVTALRPALQQPERVKQPNAAPYRLKPPPHR